MSGERSLRLKWDVPRICAVAFSFGSGGGC